MVPCPAVAKAVTAVPNSLLWTGGDRRNLSGGADQIGGSRACRTRIFVTHGNPMSGCLTSVWSERLDFGQAPGERLCVPSGADRGC
jgi:hypothetical protein